MIKKLLPLALLLPFFGIAQSNKQAQEIYAKSIAAQSTTITAVPTRGVIDCTSVDVPYIEGFESATVPGFPECTTLENAGAGNDFVTAANPGYGFGTTKVMRYTWNTASAANAWFFTTGLNLTGGETYNINYRYGSAGATLYTEKLKVHVGTDASSAAMDAVPLIDHPLVNNNVTPLYDSLSFTPATTGVYYVGFNCYSNADQFYLFIDDISVSPVLATNHIDGIMLNYYPNPVSDVLNISAAQKLESIAVYNLLGQIVSQTTPGAEKAQIDMRSLAKGNYLVKAATATGEKTFKITKD
jgi:hypothetical protein